jgi:cellulose biosynthesis protein BcsQ
LAKIVLLVSVNPGSGQTTITVNLAAALVRKERRVLIIEKGENPKLKTWLNIDRETDDQVNVQTEIETVKTSALAGIDFWSMDEANTIPAAFNSNYDYIFLLPKTKSSCKTLLKLSNHSIVCCDLSQKNAANEVISLDRNLHDLNKAAHHFSLVVLNKINTKEWHNNTENFSLLADYFGYERIADPIPHCERIHGLPLDGRTVWELSQENLRDAFMRLTEAIESL